MLHSVINLNKIIIRDNEIDFKLSDNIKLEYLSKEENIVDKIKLTILKNSKLEIEYLNSDEIKLEVEIIIGKNVNSTIYHFYDCGKNKIKYNYELLENSNLRIERFHNSLDTNELTTVYLNGEKAEFNYFTNIISKTKEKYDIVVYHNSKETISNINMNIVNTGLVNVNLTSSVEEGIKDCILNQEGRIVNLSNNICEFNPNLLIEEYEVEANHSVYVGGVKEEELFYLMSRGINENDAYKLILNGLLISNMNKNKKEIKNIIDNSLEGIDDV